MFNFLDYNRVIIFRNLTVILLNATIEAGVYMFHGYFMIRCVINIIDTTKCIGNIEFQIPRNKIFTVGPVQETGRYCGSARLQLDRGTLQEELMV